MNETFSEFDTTLELKPRYADNPSNLCGECLFSSSGKGDRSLSHLASWTKDIPQLLKLSCFKPLDPSKKMCVLHSLHHLETRRTRKKKVKMEKNTFLGEACLHEYGEIDIYYVSAILHHRNVNSIQKSLTFTEKTLQTFDALYFL